MAETHTTRIARSPDEVSDFLVDPANWARIDPALVDLQPRARLALGAMGTMTRRVGGMRVTTAWEVTGLDPGSRLAMCITGRGYRLTETITLAAEGAGTLVTVVDDLLPTSLAGRAFVAISGPFIRRDLRDRTARLTTLLGSSASSETAGPR
jgi:hypothetical protein